MKIALLYSLLIYQLLQHCDATGNGGRWLAVYLMCYIYCSSTGQCRPLQEIRNGTPGAETATILVYPGSSVSLNAPTDVTCSHPDNDVDSYALLHESHRNQQLRIITQQPADHKFTIPNVQLSTSRIYCAYKQCVPEDMEQCCIRIIG